MSTPNQLSTDEIAHQRGLLEELRTRHSQQLIDSGIAERAIASALATPSNSHGITKPLSAESTLYPFRKEIGNMPVYRIGKLQVDTGMVHRNTDFVAGMSTIGRILGTSHNPSYALNLGRYDLVDGGSNSCGYIGGVLLSSDIADTPEHGRLRPVEGFTVEDLELIQLQLGEIATAKSEHGLSIISAETLADDPEIVGWL